MTENEMRSALTRVLEKLAKTPQDQKHPQIPKAVREHLTVPPAAQPLLNDALHRAMFEIVASSTEENDALFTALYDLLDVALHCTEAAKLARKGYQDPARQFNLIEDLLDVLTVTGAERVIDYMESRAERLTASIEPNKGKGLVLLRLCNEILRRLSKTRNAVTSGRLLIFLASVFPLSERSGVNLRGEFNVKNETHYEGENTESNRMDIDGEPGIESFYRMFWNLQRFFVNPLLLTEPSNMEILRLGIEATLKKFDVINKEAASHMAKPKEEKTSAEDRKRKYRSDECDDQQTNFDDTIPKRRRSMHFFPKFLTNPNLFELELRDPSFRRQILAQISIVLQYLSMLSQEEKVKVAQEFADNPQLSQNKAVQQAFTLTPAQEKWVREARTSLYRTSEATIPNGKQFARNLSTVITHERNWVEWKNRSCQSFETAYVNVEDKGKKTRLQGCDAVRRRNWLGNDDMTALWTEGDKAEAVMRNFRQRGRCMPQLDIILGALDEQLDINGDLTDGIEEEYAMYKDMRYNWRSYRVAMRDNLGLFHGNRHGDIQIDSQIPGKSLLMQWRKEKRGDGEVPSDQLVESIKEEADAPHTQANLNGVDQQQSMPGTPVEDQVMENTNNEELGTMPPAKKLKVESN